MTLVGHEISSRRHTVSAGSSVVRPVVGVLLLAFSYAAGGHLGQLAAIPPGSVSPIWPAAGIGLAALLRFGLRLWPGVWIGSFAVNWWAHVQNGGEISWKTVVAFGCVATGASVAAVVAAMRLEHRKDLFSRARDVVAFVFVGAVFTALISATIGTTSLLLGSVIGRGSFAQTWATWLLGDAAGILVVSPLVLVWTGPRLRFSRRVAIDAALFSAALVASCVLVFATSRYSLFFLLIPVLVTAAFRYGAHGSTASLAAISAISLIATTAGIGPFAVSGLTQNESLLLLQSFTGVIVVTTLILSAVLSEREQKAMEVRRQQALFIETQLRLQEELYTRAELQGELRTAFIVESSADMISRTTPTGEFLYVSRASVPLLDYEPSELIGKSIFDFLHPDEAIEIRELTSMLMAQKGVATLSYRFRRKDGIYLWFETTSRAISDEGVIEEIVSVSREITDRKRAEEQIEHQVYHDPLTDLPNRLLLEDRASVAVARAKRQRTRTAVMFMDLDRFKHVNDTLGHAMGDEVLQHVAKRLRDSIRGSDTLARVGGDEFVTLLPDLHENKDATRIARKIIAALQEPFLLYGHEIQLGVSIGIAVYPLDGNEVQTLLRAADRAMYRAKLAGGNSWEMHTPAMSTETADLLALEADLRHAIERGELDVAYQPQIELHSGVIVAAEALVRWPHPTRGLLPPDTFVPLAEDSRLISGLGAFVLRRACRDLQAWRTNGARDIRVAVNVSAIQFRDRTLVDTIASALNETGLPPDLLELEITESTLMHGADKALAVLHRLKAMGVHLAIDDFGVGYSSLSYLRRFPVSCVKIDRSFVSGLDAKEGDAAIISAVVGLGSALGLRVVAEGVESDQQSQLLQKLGCLLGQGFLFTPAVTASEMAALLAGSSPSSRTAY